MTLINDSQTLATLCKELSHETFITIDTEFIREKSYYPKLCLVQIASQSLAFAIDPLSSVDLKPLFELLANTNVLKVFHACRQDIEIFFNMTGAVPTPIFDTQVAAMVCGFGAAVSYANLVAELAGENVDKSSRFTDWSRRPLSEKQLKYALSDVTHLRTIYPKLQTLLEREQRTPWLAEEMADLTDPASYTIDPNTVWEKLRPRSHSRRFLGVIRELAKWRELKAQKLDKPRGHIMKDPTLLELAAAAPDSLEELRQIRGIGRMSPDTSHEILQAIAHAKSLPDTDLPATKRKNAYNAQEDKALVELLKVLLKTQCELHQVASKLVATNDELLALAFQHSPEVPAMSGWRYEVFGKHAIALKEGKIALSADGEHVKLVPIV